MWIMNTASLYNLWNYLEGLSLTANNKRWLSERLIESSHPKETVESATAALDENMLSPRVRRIMGSVKLDKEAIENDDRLTYLLSK